MPPGVLGVVVRVLPRDGHPPQVVSRKQARLEEDVISWQRRMCISQVSKYHVAYGRARSQITGQNSVREPLLRLPINQSTTMLPQSR